jgi:hypothetical protein
MDGRTDVWPTVRGLPDGPLPVPRVRSLEMACDQLATRPLADTLAELGRVVARPVTGEECRRLHVLVSTLYHRAGAPLSLTEQLRAEIETAKSRRHHHYHHRTEE